jgi:hypothetical protein
MTAQVAGDVLQHLKGDQHGEEITEHFDQAITQPRGASWSDQRNQNLLDQLDQGGGDHHTGDHGEHLGHQPLQRVNAVQKAGKRPVGTWHGTAQLLKGS